MKSRSATDSLARSACFEVALIVSAEQAQWWRFWAQCATSKLALQASVSFQTKPSAEEMTLDVRPLQVVRTRLSVGPL